MYYIVALGNPGETYLNTRHNVGWQALDSVLAHSGIPVPILNKKYSGRVTEGLIENEPITILYPETFMNNSGASVIKLVLPSQSKQLVVIHDDIDLPFGEVKVVFGRGAGGNNGVKSIIETLGTKDFIRIRIGIAPKSFWTGKVKRPAGGGPLERFVLQPFSAGEQKQLEAIFLQVDQALKSIVQHGVGVAMNECN